MDDENAQEEEAAEGRKDNSMPHDAAAQSWCGLDFDKWISLAVTVRQFSSLTHMTLVLIGVSAGTVRLRSNTQRRTP